MKSILSVPRHKACPCGSGLSYGDCCHDRVQGMTFQIRRRVKEKMPKSTKADLPFADTGFITGLRAHQERVPDVTEAAEALCTVAAAAAHGHSSSQSARGLTKQLVAFLRRNKFPRFSAPSLVADMKAHPLKKHHRSLAKCLANLDELGRNALISSAIEPQLTEPFLIDSAWDMLYGARAPQRKRGELPAILWGLYHLRKPVSPLTHNPLWAATFSLTMTEYWGGLMEIDQLQNQIDPKHRPLEFRDRLLTTISGYTALQMAVYEKDHLFPGNDTGKSR